MHGGELAALYPLQHGLARDAEESGSFKHRDMALWCFRDKAGTNLLIDADAPWRTRGDLFARNKTIGQPTMHGGRGHAEDFRGPLDGHQLALGGNRGRVESRDLPIPAEIADLVGREPIVVSRASALPV